MTSTVVTPSEKRELWFVILASSVGTLIEWYDFYIFGSLATVIATQFFPADDPNAGFLLTLAIFAAGFIVRPFGALVFGSIGDRVGRKYAFLVTLVIMGGSTFCIGLVPGYESIGIFAPIIVMTLRLLQGLALGGEYGGAATYVAEHSPAAKRGFYTSFIQTTATLGLFVSLGVILAVRQSMSPEAFGDWGWRIPFLVSALLVIVSIFIRLRMSESPLFAKVKATGKLSKSPLKESFTKKENLKMVLIALFGATAGQGVVWYTGQYYAMSFIQKTCNLEYVQSIYIVATALVIGTPLFIYFGWLSDRVGRKVLMMIGLLGAVILYRPVYGMMYELTDTQNKVVVSEKQISEGTFQNVYEDGTILNLHDDPNLGVTREVVLSNTGFWMMVFYILIQVVLVTMVYGPIAAFLVELFPTRIRYTSMSLPYHIGNGVFGGLTPYIATKLTLSSDGDPYIGLLYPILVAAFSFVIGMIFLRNRTQAEVNEADES